jgi:hypothetical protein
VTPQATARRGGRSRSGLKRPEPGGEGEERDETVLGSVVTHKLWAKRPIRPSNRFSADKCLKKPVIHEFVALATA